MAEDFIPAFVLPDSQSKDWPIDPNAKRIEINEFVPDKCMTNLFLLALKSMKEDPLDNPFSYYNLSTIHGLPLELRRDAENKSTLTRNKWEQADAAAGYYCTHGSNVFPTWHRCQMLTFEQAVFRMMESLANQFIDPDLKKYHQDALQRYRLPYWDPVKPRVKYDDSLPVKNMFAMPEILSTPKRDAVDNPHYSFYFPGNDALRKVNKTVIDWPDRRISEENFRAPSLNRKTGEVIRNDAWLTQALQQQGQSFSIALWQMLNPKYPENVERSWDYFSNHDTVYNDPKFNSDPDPKKDNLRRIQTSLEAWHDNIHGMIGQGRGVQGHMGNPAIASFDPIFWLHHNNMERLFALYQALYDEHQKNEQYFVSETTTSKFPKATRNTELSPFERVKGTSYTSKEVRDWRVDGYAVPGDGGREAAEKYIQTNYYWQTEGTKPPKSASINPPDTSKSFALNADKLGFKFDPTPPTDILYKEIKNHSLMLTQVSQQAVADVATVPLPTEIISAKQNMDTYPRGSFLDREEGRMMTWNVQFRVRNVQVFIGKGRVPPDEDAPSYITADQEVGYSSIFAYKPDADCDNCIANRDLMYADLIPLMTMLPDFLEANQKPDDVWPPRELRQLKNLEPDGSDGHPGVRDFLREQLEWRIVDIAGNVRSAEEVTASGLELVFVARTFTLPTNEQPLGEYGQQVLYTDITAGKVGGYRG